MPVFLVGDTFNRVVWLRQGYTIGLGEQLLQVKSHLCLLPRARAIPYYRAR